MNLVVKAIGSFLFTGYFPIAPATFACLVYGLAYWLVPGGGILAHPVLCAATLLVSVPVAGKMEKHYGNDPPCVVIDEVVGMQVVLVGAAGVSPWGLLAAFLLFRAFDIGKPFPIRRSQHLPGGWGIVADDVLAGVYSRIVVGLLSIWIPSLGDFLPR